MTYAAILLLFGLGPLSLFWLAAPHLLRRYKSTLLVIVILILQRGQSDRLEEDIRTYVMFNGCWAPEELEYKLGIQRLLRVGQLHLVSSPRLCCDAFPYVCIHCDKTLAIMRQILNYRNNGR